MVVSLAPSFTIKVLESIGRYEPGRLYTMKVDSISEHGSRGRVNSYFFKLPNGRIRGENARVFGWGIMLTTVPMVALALIFTLVWSTMV
jgi:hypothetical protein